MNRAGAIKEVVLGGETRLEHLVAVARYGARVSFGKAYTERVNMCRELVEGFVKEKRRIYGITTGLGENVKRGIPEEAALHYQQNTLLTHCTTVGTPLDTEAVRALLFVQLLNMGTGCSGVRLELLECIAELLNKGVTPVVPSHGSVGYLGAEAHAGLVLTGNGKACYKGKQMDAGDALKKSRISPIKLSYKEGLSLVNGVTSVTALAALAAYDARNLVASADVVAACTLEALCVNMSAYSDRVMDVKRHKEQAQTAGHLRSILRDSRLLAELGGRNLQEALSLRGVPQAHGAVRKTVNDAVKAIEDELNSCGDNPIINPPCEAISGCNCDGGYIGIETDSLCIAMGYLSKISERRTDRMVNEHISGLPPFLVANPGENSGYMILQYSSAGLLGEIRVLSHPASVDAVPTCALQEDYVSMAYNSALKSRDVVKLAEYIIGNELLASTQAAEIRGGVDSLSAITANVSAAVREKAVFMKEDHYIYPDMEWTYELIHSGRVRDIAEDKIGDMYITHD